jgi:Leucine-rich repeat (LRR) protein
MVSVSRRFARRSDLTHRLQLDGMGLTEVPSELFRKKDVKILHLHNNNLSSLPREIAQLATVAWLYVRLSKRSGTM